MARLNEPPQTVAEALDNHWQYLRVTCQICRRYGHVYFDQHPAKERIASLIRRCKCLDCNRRTPLSVVIGFETLYEPSPHEKPIHVEGDKVFSGGMF